jgi:hypothetical protein
LVVERINYFAKAMEELSKLKREMESEAMKNE